MSVQNLCPFKKLGYLSFHCWVVEVLYIFWIPVLYQSFTRHMICKYFLQFCGFSFHFLHGVLWSTKLFNFDEVTLLIFFLLFCVLLMSLSNHSLTQGYKDSLLCFFLRVLYFNSHIWSTIHFEFNFVHGVQWGVQIYSHVYPVVSVLFVEMTILSPFNYLGTLVETNRS